MGDLIAVLSGKGGTGKTSVCAGIATALAEGGSKVLCIDCDVGLRNLDLSLGISELASLSFVDLYSDGLPLEKATRHPQYPGLYFLTAPMNCDATDIDHAAFHKLLKAARGQFHYVFLDAPAGVDAGFQLAARYTDRVLVVTGADPASIRDARRAGELLELMGKTDVRIVVNRVNPKLFKALGTTVDDIMDSVGLPLMGIVPEDPSVMLAAAFEKPLLKYNKNSPAVYAFRRITRRLQGLSVPVDL